MTDVEHSTNMKLSEHRKGRGHFQLMPGDRLRWDSPIFIDLSFDIWNGWCEYLRSTRLEHGINYMVDNNLLYDVDECGDCQFLSAEHLGAIMKWRDENNEKQEVLLDV